MVSTSSVPWGWDGIVPAPGSAWGAAATATAHSPAAQLSARGPVLAHCTWSAAVTAITAPALTAAAGGRDVEGLARSVGDVGSAPGPSAVTPRGSFHLLQAQRGRAADPGFPPTTHLSPLPDRELAEKTSTTQLNKMFKLVSLF